MNEKIDVLETASLAKLRLSSDEAERLEREIQQFTQFARILDVYADSNGLVAGLTEKEYGREDAVFSADMDICGISNSVSDGYITVPLTVEAE